jgi:hypothetical protein
VSYDDDTVTLGEVNRNVIDLRSDIKELTKDVTELKVSTGTQADRVRRLEGIVYGTGAVATAGLVTAVLGVVLRKG